MASYLKEWQPSRSESVTSKLSPCGRSPAGASAIRLDGPTLGAMPPAWRRRHRLYL